ncbi:MAG: DUF58 domain-containing protein [Planctomycetia bacterium]|nr:DUF58 domain-containing protein [Planctomycetia bacterium]
MSGGLSLILVILATMAPLCGLARYWRIFPHRPFLYLLLVPCGLACGLILLPESQLWNGLWALAAVEVVLVVVLVVDLFTLPHARHFEAERTTQRVASLIKQHSVALTVSNRSGRAWTVWVRDDVDSRLRPMPEDFIVELPPQSRSTLRYEMRPTRRGAFTMQCIHLQVRSRGGFWRRFFSYPAVSTIHVYPDLKQLSEYAVLARTNRLSQIGVRRTRKVGQDHEFERLRDFTPDDNYKHIDWRTTARRRKLTVRDYQASQSQRIVFLIDCGRMMTNEAGGLSLLDHAMNAALMLTYVALRQGDSVGLLNFSDSVHDFVPPKGGMSQMNRLLHASFDRFPRLVESRYDQAFRYLATHCRKRALVVLITNVIDEVNARQIEQQLGALTGKHLPLGVLLRDHRLYDAVEDSPRPASTIYRAAAAADILLWRSQVLRDLKTRGALTIDVFPEDLTAPLVNQYLNIKARHLL